MARVSLGLPVYNGENFLEECLDSILSQTFEDFELIISDNASTDKTAVICRSYAEQDSRIRVITQRKNIGAAENFNLLIHQMTGEFVKWCAHDDILRPTFLQQMLEFLEHNPQAILSHCITTIVNQSGEAIETFTPNFAMLPDDPVGRLRQVILHGSRCYEIFGLIRRDALMQTKLIGNHRGGDNVLLCRLVMLGSFEIVPEPLFLLRRHEKQSTIYVPNSQAYHQWFTGQIRRITFPDWHFVLENWKISSGIKLSVGERLRFFMVMSYYTYTIRRRLLQNIRVAIESLIFNDTDPMNRRRLFKRQDRS